MNQILKKHCITFLILFLLSFSFKSTIAAPKINSGHLPVYYGKFPINNMFEPQDIATNGTFLFIADSTYNNISVYTLDGQFVETFGENGSAPGQMFEPWGIVCINNTLYIADNGNNRIEKFTTDGVYISGWGSKGTGDGQFTNIHGLATDGKYIYAVDLSNHNIQVFDLNGTFIRKWGSAYVNNPAQFDVIFDITISHGRVFVIDNALKNIKVFDTDGNLLFIISNTFPSDYHFDYLIYITSDDSFIYVTDANSGSIYIFNLDGVYQSTYAGSYTNSHLVSASGGAIVVNSKLYVIDLNYNIMFTFATLTPPENVSVYTGNSVPSLTVTWQAPIYERYIPIDSYIIYRSTDGNNFNYYVRTKNNYYVDQAINRDTTYYYKVAAVASNSSVGISDLSQAGSGQFSINSLVSSTSAGFLPISTTFVIIGLVVSVTSVGKLRKLKIKKF